MQLTCCLGSGKPNNILHLGTVGQSMPHEGRVSHHFLSHQLEAGEDLNLFLWKK